MDESNIKLTYIVWDWSFTKICEVDRNKYKTTFDRLRYITECTCYPYSRYAGEFITTTDLVGTLNSIKDDYDYVVVAGVGLYGRSQYISHKKNYDILIDFLSKNQPDIAGHIIDKIDNGLYYKLHQQYFILKTDIVDQFTDDMFFDETERDWYMPKRSVDSHHGTYTPFWLMSPEIPEYKKLKGRFSSKLIEDGVKNNLKIIRISNDMYTGKCYFHTNSNKIDILTSTLDDVFENKEIQSEHYAGKQLFSLNNISSEIL